MLHPNALGLVIPGRDDDLFTRLVVGWSMKDRPIQELANEGLMMAVEQRRPSQASFITSTRDFVLQFKLRRTVEKTRDAAQHERQGQLL